MLHEFGADLDISNNDGATPAYVAACNGHGNTLMLLHELGADLDQQNKNGATPAYIAAQKGQLAALRILKNLGADVSRAKDEGFTVSCAKEACNSTIMGMSAPIDCATCCTIQFSQPFVMGW